MEISSYRELYRQNLHLPLKNKMDTDEKVVRKELVKVWTRIMEKYARPGAHIPSPEVIRQELLREGVNAAVSAVVDEHWFVFSFMIRDEIQKKVEKGLEGFNLIDFLEDVKTAQSDPRLLRELRVKIRQYVLFDKF